MANIQKGHAFVERKCGSNLSYVFKWLQIRVLAFNFSVLKIDAEVSSVFEMWIGTSDFSGSFFAV